MGGQLVHASKLIVTAKTFSPAIQGIIVLHQYAGRLLIVVVYGHHFSCRCKFCHENFATLKMPWHKLNSAWKFVASSKNGKVR